MRSGLVAIAAGLAGLLLGSAAQAADEWKPAAGPQWAKTLEAAKKEGVVVVAGHPQLTPKLTGAFQKDTGLTIEFFGAAARELDSRIKREIRAKRVTIDVMFGGASNLDMIPQGALQPLPPRLMLDEVTDATKWRDGKLKWADNAQQYLFIPNEYVFGWLAYNPTLVKADEIRTWQDLLKPEYKDKIAAHDPRSPGPGLAYAAYLGELFGVDFVKKLYIGQDAMMTTDSRQLVDWVARGTYRFALSALPPFIERYKADKLNIAVMNLEDGPGSLIGGSSVVWIPAGAPHSDGATVFLNWYLSQRGQQIYSEIWQSPSRRLDVSTDHVPDYVIPKSGVKYFDQYQEDWYLNTRPKLSDAIVEATGGR
jgi:ABC-type Fe3+ transport system substrate-binding protein